jgi:MFS family permease
MPALVAIALTSKDDVNTRGVIRHLGRERRCPSLQRDLHVSDAALQLIVGGYAFMYASGMVTGGRLGDLFGYRRMFMIGVISFATASLLCGLAQSSGQLVAARLLQGLTGAAMVPQVLALITATFPSASAAAPWPGSA